MIEQGEDVGLVMSQRRSDMRRAEEIRRERAAEAEARHAELRAEDLRERQGLVQTGSLEVKATETIDPMSKSEASDPDAPMRMGRIAVFAILVVVLLALWIAERRGRSPA